MQSDHITRPLVGKKVRIYSADGLMREGLLKGVRGKALTIIGKNYRGKEGKEIIFNLDQVFMIEEQ